jgi:uncharacterized membrane protein
MRILSAAALFGMVVAVAGCNQESSPGGPGVSNQSKTSTTTSTTPAESTSTTTTAQKPVVVTDKNNTFTLEVPRMTTNVNRGKKEDVTIAISRGSAFKESVKLQFHVPKGVTITPAEPIIQAGQSKVTVSIQADGNAPAGKTEIGVTAVPESGQSVSLQMPVQVKQG